METKEKIWKGDYVPMSAMLVNSQASISATSWSFQQVGENLVAQHTLQSKKEIKDIGTWTNAFIIFMGVYMLKHAHRGQELLKYLASIRSYAQGFSTEAWLGYDVEFRMKQEREPTRSWAVSDMEAYARMLMYSRLPQHVTTKGGPQQAGFSAGRAPLPQKTNLPCFAFNRGECSKGEHLCRFRHICQTCNTPGHTARSCYRQGSPTPQMQC